MYTRFGPPPFPPNPPTAHTHKQQYSQQAMKRLLDSPLPSSGEQYYREDVLLSPREFPLPEGERAWKVACSGALTAVVTGRCVRVGGCG